MLLWFAGIAFVLAWAVFRDTALDYRLVMGGALLPDAVDAFVGRPALLHTLACSAALLAIVMVSTRSRRQARRRLLAVPIGTFAHLVLDGVWARTALFWWPMFGTAFARGDLPSLSRPVPVVVLQELVGAAALAWGWRRFRLSDGEHRRRFIRTGRLGREFRPPRG